MAKTVIKMTLGDDAAGQLLQLQLERCGRPGKPSVEILRSWAALGCLLEHQGWRLAKNRTQMHAIPPAPTDDSGG